MTEPTLFQAFVLGVLQGLTEFLPVSSSAHLSLAPWAFSWPEPGLAFDVSLHVGTLVALFWYFRREWLAIARAAFAVAATRRVEGEQQWRAVFLVIATIPGAVAGLLLEKKAETVFRVPGLTAAALIVMGAVMWAVDARSGNARRLSAMRWRDALLVGCAQAFAIVPGISRSGATLTAGRALGFDRSSAAVFSFMMSMPIIAAAAVLKVPEALAASGLTMPLTVGVASAAVSSWIAIDFLLRFIRNRGFALFGAYRILLGAAVLGLVFLRSA